MAGGGVIGLVGITRLLWFARQALQLAHLRAEVSLSRLITTMARVIKQAAQARRRVYPARVESNLSGDGDHDDDDETSPSGVIKSALVQLRLCSF